jgi:hypothetical protein
VITTAPQGAYHIDDKASVEAGFEGLESRTTDNQKCKRNATKTERILRVFYESGRKFNFQSIREHGDSCLHSTISTFRHMYGIEFDDEPHVVRGFGGNATRCKNYWLRRTPENLRRVRAYLNLGDSNEDANP